MPATGLAGLFAELRRRRVFRVAVVYAIVAWLVIQVAETVFPLLGLPEWTVTFVVALVALGAPIALVLAWAFELSPDGVRRTQPPPTGHVAGPAPRAAAWVGLGILIALVGFGALAYLGPGTGKDEVDRSIAVLPFTDMSPDRDQSYLSDGITEDILTKLAALSGFRVPSRTSVMQYRGTTKDMRTIGRELGVAWILEGSVRRDGNRVKITGQLIRADTDEHVWADNYERPLTDIFAVQNEIAERIADALEIELSAAERSRLAGSGTDDAEAYDLYLRGRDVMRRPRSSMAEIERHSAEAVALYREALALDADYALAYVGLADAYWGGPGVDLDAQYDSTVAFSRRAIRLDPGLADAYVTLANAYTLRGQRDAALEQLRYALELSPNHADALGALALLHLEAGRLVEARRMLGRALAVDPLNADFHDQVARIYSLLGDWDRAEHWFRRAHEELRPHPGRLSCELAHLALRRGDLEAGRAHLRDMLRLEPEDGQFSNGCAGSFAYLAGDFADAAEHYARGVTNFVHPFMMPLLEAIGDPDRVRQAMEGAEAKLDEFTLLSPADRAYARANVAAWRGDAEEALRRLEAARAVGYREARVLELDPAWDTLRNDPRFQAIVAAAHAELSAMRAELAREGF